MLEQVFEDAKSKIGQVTKDEKKYSALLKNLVLQVRAPAPGRSWRRPAVRDADPARTQALYTLMEKDITVSGRPKDQKLLKKAVEEASKEFKEKAGIDVQCDVNDELGDKS